MNRLLFLVASASSLNIPRHRSLYRDSVRVLSASNDVNTVSRRASLLGLASFAAPSSRVFGATVPAGVGIRGADPNGPTYSLPRLPYDVAALEPSLSKELVEQQVNIHAGYVETLNKAFQGKPNPIALAKLQKEVKGIFGDMTPELRAAVGGHYNRCLFFYSLGPEDDFGPSAALSKAIDTNFGGSDAFEGAFKKAAVATAEAGGGWVWLGVTPTGNKLVISPTKGEDNPLMEGSLFPFLGINVNPNAYEKQFGDDIEAYVAAFFTVVNWRRVSSNYLQFSTDKTAVPCVEGDLLAAPPPSYIR